MVKTTVGWLDDQTTNEPKKVIEEEIKDVAWTVHTEIAEDFQKNEEATDYQHLLNKPNMTEKDKANMEKSIKFLVDKKMDTEENFKKLEAINYGSNYIEIGGVKRARENLKAEPNNKNIFKHDDEIYFKFDALKEQNKLLANKGMEVPWKDDFIKSLKALPWDYSEGNWYTGANILWNILDLSLSGCCNSDGVPILQGGFGFVGSFSEFGRLRAWNFKFQEDRGKLYSNSRAFALAIRPVFK